MNRRLRERFWPYCFSRIGALGRVRTVDKECDRNVGDAIRLDGLVSFKSVGRLRTDQGEVWLDRYK